MVEDYIVSTDPSSTIILTDRLKINECFYHFRNILKNGSFSGLPSQNSKALAISNNESNGNIK